MSLPAYSNSSRPTTPRRGPSKWFESLKSGWPQYAEAAKRKAATAASAEADPGYRLLRDFGVGHLAAATTDAAGTVYDWKEALRSHSGITIWTDGSVTNPHEERKKDGYAAVVLKEQSPHRITPLAVAAGRYAGPHCHSDMLEAMAIAHALCCVPPDKDVRLMTDSRTCTNWWKHYVDDPAPWQDSMRRSTPTYKVWKVIADRVRRRQGTTTIEWV